MVMVMVMVMVGDGDGDRDGDGRSEAYPIKERLFSPKPSSITIDKFYIVNAVFPKL